MVEIAEKLISLVAEGKATRFNPICAFGKQYQVEQYTEKLLLAYLEANPDRRVCCLSGESFVTQVLMSICGHYQDEFHKRIRMADLLVFTNIGAIQGKRSSMWEFYSLFDNYYEQGKMIVIGSSTPYSDLTALDDRVLTQLQSGIILKL